MKKSIIIFLFGMTIPIVVYFGMRVYNNFENPNVVLSKQSPTKSTLIGSNSVIGDAVHNMPTNVSNNTIGTDNTIIGSAPVSNSVIEDEDSKKDCPPVNIIDPKPPVLKIGSRTTINGVEYIWAVLDEAERLINEEGYIYVRAENNWHLVYKVISQQFKPFQPNRRRGLFRR